MPIPGEKPLPIIEDFDEKEFYLDEFRGHTLLFSVPVEELAHDEDYERLAGIVHELLTNNTRVLVLVRVPDSGGGEQVLRRLQRRLGPLIFSEETIPLFAHRRPRAEAFLQLAADAFAAPESAAALLTTIWFVLRRGPLFVGVTAGVNHAEATSLAQEIASRLRVHKLILVEPEGGVAGADGKQISFMDEQLLATLQSAGEAEWAGLAARRATFDAVRAALLGGVSSVNLCTLVGAARELFTYEGSGTLFTRADYCRVERVGIDDFEEMERLIERGQREGVLKLRSSEEVAVLLINAYGATVGAHHLAGICGLLTQPYAAEQAGEIVGLYAITRFKGEGVGGRLVSRALAEARAAGLAYVFACTTEERAQLFFERQGFRRVAPTDVPAVKWADYDPKRKAQVAVYRFDLEGTTG
jgi:N-acetylglutamate synthase-like GNAT family acetyltransferase